MRVSCSSVLEQTTNPMKWFAIWMEIKLQRGVSYPHSQTSVTVFITHLRLTPWNACHFRTLDKLWSQECKSGVMKDWTHTHTHMASENTVSLEKECKYYFHDSFQSCNKTPRSVAAKAKIQTWTSGFNVKQLYRFRFDPVWQSHFTNSLQFYLKGWCNK